MRQMRIDAMTRAAADLGYHVTVVEDASRTEGHKFGKIEVAVSQTYTAFMAQLAMSYAKIV